MIILIQSNFQNDLIIKNSRIEIISEILKPSSITTFIDHIVIQLKILI